MGLRAILSSRLGWITLLGTASFVLALGRIHVRAQTTLIGYEIGRLKSTEGKELEQRSALRMQLAKVSSQKHLNLISGQDRGPAEVLATK